MLCILETPAYMTRHLNLYEALVVFGPLSMKDAINLARGKGLQSPHRAVQKLLLGGKARLDRFMRVEAVVGVTDLLSIVDSFSMTYHMKSEAASATHTLWELSVVWANTCEQSTYLGLSAEEAAQKALQHIKKHIAV